MVARLSIPKARIRVVLFEGLHENARKTFEAAGYGSVESIKDSLTETDFQRCIRDAHIVGIRSRTQMTADVLASARRLIGIGCFCIGTNQVHVDAARRQGVPVFNAPYSNTRSVAELVIGEIIMLMRRIPEKSTLAHAGVWRKTADSAHEVRGKILGIVGYGHIGTQVSILAEALGMRVRFVDIEDKLAMGNVQACGGLDELLATADVISLHVPETPLTRGMIGVRELARMKPGAILINAARGTVVDVDALAEAIRSGHLSGAAVDVFPNEPSDTDAILVTPLRGLANVILTPHVGGSTLEAQANIGTEVAEKLIRYSDDGSTVGAVNFPEVSLPQQRNVTRFLHIHRNVPGVLRRITEVFSDRDLNIAGQYLRTDSEVGYVVTDIDGRLEAGKGIRRALEAIDGTVRVRFLY